MSSSTSFVVRLTLDGASQMQKGLAGIGHGFKTFGDSVRSGAAFLHHGTEIGVRFWQATTNIAGAAARAGQALIGPNAEYEQMALQFEQLLGSAEAAKERMEELNRFSGKSFFKEADVYQAGFLLQKFGGSALGASGKLELVGDMAAFSRTGIVEVAQAIGRAYSALESGEPLGRAATQLQQMGLLTIVESKALNEMAEGGASAGEIMNELAAYMAKTSGAAAKMAGSYDGVVQSLDKSWDEIKRKVGTPLFEAFKKDLSGVRDEINAGFDSGRVDAFAASLGESIKKVYASVKEKGVGGLSPTLIMDAAEAGRLGDLLSTVFKTAASNFGRGLYNAMVEYGPDIQRMIIPKRMWGSLGIRSPEEEASLRSMAKGEGGDVGALGFWTRASLGLTQITGSVMGGGLKEGYDAETAKIWADKKLGFGLPKLGYLSMPNELGKLGIPSSSYVDKRESVEDSIAKDIQAGLKKELEGAASAAKELATNLRDANAAVF